MAGKAGIGYCVDVAVPSDEGRGQAVHQNHGRPFSSNGIADVDSAYIDVFNPRLVH